MIGDLDAAERAIAMLKDRALNLNAAHWTINGRCLEAKLLVMRGEFAAGSALLHTELARAASTGWAVGYPEFMGTRAEALAGLGRFAEAITTVDDALARAKACGECYSVAELLRIKGELLLRTGEPFSATEECFDEALAVARDQGALLWELRSAMSFAQLKLNRGHSERAKQILAPVFYRFTEGFDTTDLRRARAVLDQLPLNCP
jgi:predicted ATPase